MAQTHITPTGLPAAAQPLTDEQRRHLESLIEPITEVSRAGKVCIGVATTATLLLAYFIEQTSVRPMSAVVILLACFIAGLSVTAVVERPLWIARLRWRRLLKADLADGHFQPLSTRVTRVAEIEWLEETGGIFLTEVGTDEVMFLMGLELLEYCRVGLPQDVRVHRAPNSGVVLDMFFDGDIVPLSRRFPTTSETLTYVLGQPLGCCAPGTFDEHVAMLERLAGVRRDFTPAANLPARAATIVDVAEVDMLQQCKLSFGQPPRQFAGLQQYLDMTPPDWLNENPGDELWSIYKRRHQLLTSGQVVWSFVVQANDLLMQRNPLDCPAMVVYSIDPHFDGRVEELASIAESLASLKFSQPDDEELAAFARVITSELDRSMRLAVPGIYAGTRPVFTTTVMVCRKHLPAGRLTCPVMPLIILPRLTRATMILPSRFWPKELLKRWR